jgi:hypothetical protein
MSGLYTVGWPLLAKFSGLEQLALDTQNAQGIAPESGAVSLQALAAALLYFGNTSSKTTVAGTRYFVNASWGTSQTLTGIEVLIGSVGGTDNWIVELHDANGNLLATSATAGTLAGTAGAWQQIPFTAPITVPAGNYFLVLQSNGTTAHPAVYNSPTSPLLTGSAAGTFGTGAAITPPTTYTAAAGPVALPY